MSKDIEKILKKKIETTMIGCLARFEESFGYLWGQNKEKLSDKELEFLELWERVRESILDHGNSQIRKAISELRPDSIGKVKYSYYYKFDTRRKNNEN
jgi:hypothetical protein